MRLITIMILIYSYNKYGESKLQYFKPCQESSPEFNSCLKSTAQSLVSLMVNGNPQLKLNGLDPFTIEDAVYEVSPSLKYNLTNCVIYGPASTKINYLKIDSKNKKIYLEYTNRGYMEADYALNGRSILLALVGDGKANITIDDTIYTYDIDYEIVKGKDGKNHWKIEKYKVNYSTEKLVYRFDNLFKGNKEIADNINRFTEENWKEIFAELGPPMMAKITQRIIKEIGKLFAAIPAEDMLLP